jgi:hypothetical protein
MNKKNLILKIQEYCKYYETKFVSHLDLVDMICVEMFDKHAFLTDKCGKINSYCISQKEADCIKDFLNYMQSKDVIIKKAKSFEIMPNILNYKEVI